MDDLDRKILSLLAKNARMPVKEIAEQVALTSPAVSSRIHKLETDGIISGYTVVLNRPADRVYVDALISLSVTPSHRDELVELMQNSKEVLQCYHVTGAYTFLIKVSCGSMPQLEHLILQFQKLGTKEMQISLAHGFGDGKEESCEYARQAAEGLLQDESIDFYLAMNLDGISTLNDLAGGVTVTLEDDFSEIDPAMTKGATLTLQGDQAETFVRSRMTVGDGTNESRMKRQEEFLSQLAVQLGQKVRASEQFTADLYDELQPYLVTDMARGRIINEVWNARDYTLEPALELTGEHKIADDGFTEFYPDAGSVEQAVLELFWEPVE